MKTIENSLSKIDEYLLSIKRDLTKGYYILEVGFPSKWYYQSTNYITCDVITETGEGKLINVYSENENVVIDDLIKFVTDIIDVNKKIEDKEKEFNEKLLKFKEDFQKETQDFYDNLDDLKKKTFEKKQKENAEQSK